ncbi:MAG: type II secretion system protein GspM [Proteobacteria bacterium]|nr:type II secretion system protein GspM [Pseudomonadota bacterium]
MTSKLSHWQHGLISASILIALMASFYLVLIQPALTIKKENIERIDDLSFQLRKFSNAGAQITLLEDEIKAFKKNDINNGDFLEGDAPAIVAANLQKKLKTMVKASGGNLVSTHAITGKDDGVYPKVTIKVHMQVDMKALQTVLYNLTINKPLLFIDNLLIQRRHTPSKRQNRNTGLLEVRFDVTGYLDPVAT